MYVLCHHQRAPSSPSPPFTQDDVLPEDHNIYADELPRETKRGKPASSAGGGGGRGNASGGRPTNAWSGFGSSAGGGGGARGSGSSGGAGGRGRNMAVIAGARRLNVTKQEALRSKGLFKIAPPSKVCTRNGRVAMAFAGLYVVVCVRAPTRNFFLRW